MNTILLETLGAALFRARSWTPLPLALLAVVKARPRRTLLLPGLIMVLVGLLLRLWAAIWVGPSSRTRRTDPPTERVAGGPYALLAHPIYTANGILSTGLLTLSGSWWPWLQSLFPALWLAQYGPIMRWEAAHLPAAVARWRPATDLEGAIRNERRTYQAVLGFLAAAMCGGGVNWVRDRMRKRGA